ncbi:GNAT family N-acetyltransferase [Brevundimonas subvibrioides]|uniref:GNAT family N-acetyltransferase n=1 Tax=Brevundimonas subvibrioides TaxID=74313 RepID=UPI0022B35CB8|nr:GNAT family N-acetyltransferase [Brevundimonas subvibrioides]
MQIDIVPYRPDHAAAWVALNEHWILAGGYALEAKDRLVLDDPEGAVLSKGGAIFMAERDPGLRRGEWQAVGCCSLMVMPDGGREVGKMAVAPDAQGLGLGRKLLDACEAHARSVGAPRLYLETNVAQAHAIALYRRFGFMDLPPQPTPYVRCNVWMEKRLS